MLLFDEDAERTNTGPGRYAEPHFDYLNRSGRPEAIAVRHLLESWFAAFPNAAKSGVRSRFRSPDYHPHYSAFFELYTHAMLTRLGLIIDVLVPQPGAVATRLPDFRAYHTENASFIVEATLATNRSKAESAAEARLNQVYDALNGTDSPNFFISIHVHGSPERPVPGRELRSRIERFFAELNPDECSRALNEGGLDALPKLSVDISGWRIDVRPIPKSPATRGKPGIRPLGVLGDAEASSVDDSIALRDAVAVKAGHYDDPGCPFVIAVNAVNQHLDMTDIMEALFGKETFTFSVRNDGTSDEPIMRRRPNGAWLGPRGPTNTRVSAVVVASALGPWSVAAYTPVVYHNPYARYPLGTALDRLPHYRAEGERMVGATGISSAELFELSVGWPRS